MGSPRRFATLRGTAVVAVSALVFLPLGGMKGVGAPAADSAPILTAQRVTDADTPPLRAEPWSDEEWGLAIVPPAGWMRSPMESLNPVSNPPDPVFEVARFQLRAGDASLYAQPVALTSGLLADAGAILSIGVARAGTGLVGAHPERWEETSRALKGFVASDEDLSYEGLRTFTRTFYANATDRVVVVRLIADEDEWPTVRAPMLTALMSLRAHAEKPNGPEAVAPPPPPAAPAPAPIDQVVVDPTLEIRGAIIARAATMLGIPYVWGGNSTRNGMDCSAWVSRVWGVERYSTDSIWQVSFAVAKEQLRPGDAVNLTTGRDPKRLGHIRLFEAWANNAHTLMWVYEETPPRSVHRVIAYDDRYQPIRLSGLSNAGVALVVPGTPAPERTTPPRATGQRATPRPTSKTTARPTPRPTAKATPRPTPKPGVTVRPSAVAQSTATLASGTTAINPARTPTYTYAPANYPSPMPTAKPTPTPSPSPR